jgi:hypothetical protein
MGAIFKSSTVSSLCQTETIGSETLSLYLSETLFLSLHALVLLLETSQETLVTEWRGFVIKDNWKYYYI